MTAMTGKSAGLDRTIESLSRGMANAEMPGFPGALLRHSRVTVPYAPYGILGP